MKGLKGMKSIGSKVMAKKHIAVGGWKLEGGGK